MRHGPDADIPTLLVYAIRAIAANVPRRFLHLVGKRGRNENLRQQGIRVQRDRRQQIVELIGRERLIARPSLGIILRLRIVLRRRIALGL